MTPIIRKATRQTTGISRRGFMVAMGAGGLSIAFATVSGRAEGATFAADRGEGFKPNIWVTLGLDGTATLVPPSAEMGQGVMTASPLLVAEEMEAEWSRVRVAQARPIWPTEIPYSVALRSRAAVRPCRATIRSFAWQERRPAWS